MGRNTAEGASDKTAFLTVIITSDILVKKILQTIDSVDDYGGYSRAHHIALRSQKSSKASFGLKIRMSAADKGFVIPVLPCDYNLYHRNVFRSAVDLVDLNAGVKLSVTVLLVIAGLSLVVINYNLLALALIHNSSCDSCGCDIFANLHSVSADADYLVKSNFCSALALDLLDIDDISLGNFVLP